MYYCETHFLTFQLTEKSEFLLCIAPDFGELNIFYMPPFVSRHFPTTMVFITENNENS